MPMPQEGQGGGAISQLISKVGGGVQMVSQALQQSQAVPDEAKQIAQQIAQLYDQLVQALQGGGEAGPEAQGQTAPMEAAGNKNAQPVM